MAGNDGSVAVDTMLPVPFATTLTVYATPAVRPVVMVQVAAAGVAAALEQCAPPGVAVAV